MAHGEDLLTLAQTHPNTRPDAQAEPDDVVLAIFTSGTTGKLKAVQHTQASYAGIVLNILLNLPDIRRGDVMEEVLARLRALLRRATGHATNELICGPVRLDTKAGRVVVDGAPVKLTSHEYRLLAYLMHHSGRVISRTEIVEHLYDQDFDRDSNTIEVFVGRLRKKLGVDVIQTVRGLGYLIAPPDASTAPQSASQ